jgi:hypothetical protein
MREKTSGMFEHHRKPLIGRREFLARLFRYALFSLLILLGSVGIGTAGYHYWGELRWIDAFLNASMILTGMGPVDRMETAAGKFFSAFYALFSGISFLTFAAVLFSPIYHRFLHKFHLAVEDEE